MKLTWDNILSMLLLLFVIIFPFWQGSKENYGVIWEDVSIVATIFYAAIIYVAGFAYKRFSGLSDGKKGLVGFIILIVIPVFSLPFIFGFLRMFSTDCLEIYNQYLSFARTTKLILLIIVSVLFLIVDLIMLNKAPDSKINYATNLYVSDIPVLIGFVVLLLYAFYIGDAYIEENNLNHFFEGAIAFQVMFSNIIWMYNDDEFWKKILN